MPSDVCPNRGSPSRSAFGPTAAQHRSEGRCPAPIPPRPPSHLVPGASAAPRLSSTLRRSTHPRPQPLGRDHGPRDQRLWPVSVKAFLWAHRKPTTVVGELRAAVNRRSGYPPQREADFFALSSANRSARTSASSGTRPASRASRISRAQRRASASLVESRSRPANRGASPDTFIGYAANVTDDSDVQVSRLPGVGGLFRPPDGDVSLALPPV